MCQNLVYEHNKLPKNALEHFFAKIESSFIPYHDKLVQKVKDNYLNVKKIPQEEINELLLFYVLLYLRSGALLEEYAAYSDNPKNQRVERLFENLFSSVYPAQLANTISQGYQKSIIVSKEDSFIMSDQFISTASLKYKNKFSNLSNRQIGFKDSIIFIPLTSHFYIVFYNGDKPSYIVPETYSVLNIEQTEEINNIIAKNSYNKSICGQDKPLEKVKLESEGISKPIRSMLFYKNGDVSISTIKKEIEFYDSERLFSQDYNLIFSEYKSNYEGKVARNDLCLCGSQKKYKKCCLSTHKRCLDINKKINNQKHDWYSIALDLKVEKGIEIYKGPKENIPDSIDRNLSNQLLKRKEIRDLYN